MRERLKKLMKEKGYNPYKLSIEAGLDPSAVGKILSEKSKNPKIDTMEKICHVLGISFNTLEEEVGIETDLINITIGAINFLKNQGYMENMSQQQISKFVADAHKIISEAKRENSKFELDNAHYKLIYRETING